MSGEQSPSEQRPRTLVRWLVSVLVCVHFFAILTAVTSSGSGQFGSPYVAVQLNEPFLPYLETLFLRNGYRFFAPNPGPNFVIWFRMTYEDGRVRWYEFPQRTDFATPLAYTRMLSVANMGAQTSGHPDDPDEIIIEPGTSICLASFARHVASDRLAAQDLREAGDLKTVEIYRVAHLYIMPDQIREGWDYTDLRLYQPMYLGAFRPDGSAIDPDSAVYCRTQILVTDMIQNDIAPELLSDSTLGATAADIAATLENLGIPEPVRKLVEDNPDIVSMSITDMTERVMTVLGIR